MSEVIRKHVERLRHQTEKAGISADAFEKAAKRWAKDPGNPELSFRLGQEAQKLVERLAARSRNQKAARSPRRRQARETRFGKPERRDPATVAFFYEALLSDGWTVGEIESYLEVYYGVSRSTIKRDSKYYDRLPED